MPATTGQVSMILNAIDQYLTSSGGTPAQWRVVRPKSSTNVANYFVDAGFGHPVGRQGWTATDQDVEAFFDKNQPNGAPFYETLLDPDETHLNHPNKQQGWLKRLWAWVSRSSQR